MTDQEYFESMCGGPRHLIGDFIRAVFRIDNVEDAKRFFAGGVDWLEWMKSQPDYEPSKFHSAAAIMRANIGWCFGEGMNQERIKMWHEAVGAAHPVFGIALPSPEEAFAMGAALPGPSKEEDQS